MISTSTRRPLLLGHRGARRAAPENTLAAFDLALGHGCDGFEFDLRRTADGRSIVCHDPKFAGIQIASTKFADLAGSYDASLPPKVIYAPRGKPPDQCLLACFEDVLAHFASRAYLDIELKVEGLEDSVIAALRDNPPQHGYVVSSFLPDVVQGVHSRDASIVTGLICDRSHALVRWPTLPVEVVIPKHNLVTRSLVEEIHAGEKKIFTWTVNQQEEMRRLADWGVDAIISDDSELLARSFAD